jgi:hypothetical protein
VGTTAQNCKDPTLAKHSHGAALLNTCKGAVDSDLCRLVLRRAHLRLPEGTACISCCAQEQNRAINVGDSKDGSFDICSMRGGGDSLIVLVCICAIVCECVGVRVCVCVCVCVCV